MQVQTKIYVERDDKEIELHVFGDAEPDVDACFRGHPDNWTPPEPGYAYIEGVYLDEDADEPWDDELTSDERRSAEQALYDALEDAIRSAQEDAAEAKAEAMADDYYDDYADEGRWGKYGPDIYDF